MTVATGSQAPGTKPTDAEIAKLPDAAQATYYYEEFERGGGDTKRLFAFAESSAAAAIEATLLLCKKMNRKQLFELVYKNEAAAMEVIKSPVYSSITSMSGEIILAHMAVFGHERAAMASLSIHNPPVVPFLSSKEKLTNGFLVAHFAVEHERVALEVLEHYPSIALAKSKDGWPVLYSMILRHRSVAERINKRQEIKRYVDQQLGDPAKFNEILGHGLGQDIPARR